jgi:hypothetical protein
MLRTVAIVSFLSMGLLACGGGSKPAPAEPEERTEEPAEEPAEESPTEECCCFYGEEVAHMSPAECESNSGECGNLDSCDRGEGEGEGW